MLKTNTRELSGTYTDYTPGMQSLYRYVHIIEQCTMYMYMYMQFVLQLRQLQCRSRQSGHKVLASSDKGGELREQETWCSTFTDEPGIFLTIMPMMEPTSKTLNKFILHSNEAVLEVN